MVNQFFVSLSLLYPLLLIDASIEMIPKKMMFDLIGVSHMVLKTYLSTNTGCMISVVLISVGFSLLSQ